MFHVEQCVSRIAYRTTGALIGCSTWNITQRCPLGKHTLDVPRGTFLRGATTSEPAIDVPRGTFYLQDVTAWRSTGSVPRGTMTASRSVPRTNGVPAPMFHVEQ